MGLDAVPKRPEQLGLAIGLEIFFALPITVGDHLAPGFAIEQNLKMLTTRGSANLRRYGLKKRPHFVEGFGGEIQLYNPINHGPKVPVVVKWKKLPKEIIA